MLHRLGKLLRSCGIDTILVNNKDSSHDGCVLLALQENRFILSRGSVVKKVGNPFVVHTKSNLKFPARLFTHTNVLFIQLDWIFPAEAACWSFALPRHFK